MSQNIYMIVSAILLAALLLYWEVLDYMDRKVRRLQADESGKTKISGFLTALINLSDKSIRKLLLDPLVKTVLGFAFAFALMWLLDTVSKVHEPDYLYLSVLTFPYAWIILKYVLRLIANFFQAGCLGWLLGIILFFLGLGLALAIGPYFFIAFVLWQGFCMSRTMHSMGVSSILSSLIGVAFMALYCVILYFEYKYLIEIRYNLFLPDQIPEYYSLEEILNGVWELMKFGYFK